MLYLKSTHRKTQALIDVGVILLFTHDSNSSTFWDTSSLMSYYIPFGNMRTAGFFDIQDLHGLNYYTMELGMIQF